MSLFVQYFIGGIFWLSAIIVSIMYLGMEVYPMFSIVMALTLTTVIGIIIASEVSVDQ